MSRLLLCCLLFAASAASQGQQASTGISIPSCEDPYGHHPPEPARTYDTPPKLLSSPEPEYSKEALKLRINASVQVRLHVDVTGTVDGEQVICGPGHGLNEKALEAGRKYRFRAALKDGQPVGSFVTVSVNFQTY